MNLTPHPHLVSNFFFNSHSGGVESKPGPLGTLATEWPIVPARVDYDDGEFFFLVCGVGLTSPGTAATSGLLYSPK
jgi:hypothetical protein